MRTWILFAAILIADPLYKITGAEPENSVMIVALILIILGGIIDNLELL